MSQDPKFERKLNPLNVWSLALGSIIGWGAFVMPGTTFLPKAGPLGTLIGMSLAACIMIIIAFNYGYRKPERIIRTLKITCTIAMGVMIAGLLTFQLAPHLLLNMFNPTEEFMQIGKVALRAISWHFPVAAIAIALSSSFQALGNGFYSTIVSLCRQLFALLPAAYLLSLTGCVDNVWWAFFIAEFVSLAVTVFLFIRIYRKKMHRLDKFKSLIHQRSGIYRDFSAHAPVRVLQRLCRSYIFKFLSLFSKERAARSCKYYLLYSIFIFAV
jgi:hypothetical protein